LRISPTVLLDIVTVKMKEMEEMDTRSMMKGVSE